ncbi:MAG: tetratricopeptide repeat protein, partial [Kiritimatiellia bacterium]
MLQKIDWAHASWGWMIALAILSFSTVLAIIPSLRASRGMDYVKEGDTAIVMRQFEQAYASYYKAAKRCDEGKCRLRVCQYWGVGTSKRRAWAKCPLHNDIAACYEKAIYENSIFAWRFVLAIYGDLQAQADVGDCYANGKGVARDAAEAVKWYRKAAEQGHADAQNRLGVCYANGDGVTRDDVEAVKW